MEEKTNRKMEVLSDSASEHNHGVTIAKAVAIILMVLGHSGCPEEINHFLGIMRMPLFFLMSGYCFKTKYLNDGTKYLHKRVTGVYVPCVKWGLFFLFLHNFFCNIGLYNEEFGYNIAFSVPYSVERIVHNCATMLIMLEPNEQLVGGFWFLHDLFFGSVLFYSASILIRKIHIVVLLLLLLTIAMSYFNYELYHFFYPRTVLASCFIAIGYAYKESGLQVEKSWYYIIATVLIIAFVSTKWYSNFMEFGWRDVVPYVFLAVLGSLMIFGLGERMNAMRESRFKSFLIFVGGKTFNVLTWHFLSFKLVSLVIVLVYGLPWNQIAEFPVIEKYASTGWYPVYFVIGVGIPVVWSYYYDKARKYLKEQIS